MWRIEKYTNDQYKHIVPAAEKLKQKTEIKAQEKNNYKCINKTYGGFRGEKTRAGYKIIIS